MIMMDFRVRTSVLRRIYIYIFCNQIHGHVAQGTMVWPNNMVSITGSITAGIGSLEHNMGCITTTWYCKKKWKDTDL